MANNILYLYCPRCNKALSLGKHFGGTYDIRTSIDEISEFMADHRWCLAYINSYLATGVCLAEEFGHGDTMTGIELPEDAEFV